MSTLKVSIDSKAFEKAIKKAPETMRRAIRAGMLEEMTEVQLDAKRTHRFTSRSHNLERSVLVKVSQDGLKGQVYLETGIAKYGPIVHEGRKKIRAPRNKVLAFNMPGQGLIFRKEVKAVKPDRFLFKAFNRRSKRIVIGLKKAIERGIRRSGL